MKSIHITKQELDTHFAHFVKLLNNIMICEPTAPEHQYIVLYKHSLSLPLLQLMGNVDILTNLNDIHRLACSAAQKLQSNNMLADRIRKSSNYSRVNRREETYTDEDYVSCRR